MSLQKFVLICAMLAVLTGEASASFFKCYEFQNNEFQSYEFQQQMQQGGGCDCGCGQPSPIIKEGQLVNRKSTGNICLGVQQPKAGAVLLLKDCQTNGDDVWQLMETGEWKQKKSGLCVGYAGFAVNLQTCNQQQDQKWVKWVTTTTTTETFFELKNQGSNKCVDLPYYGGEKGQMAQVHVCPEKDFASDNMEYKWKPALVKEGQLQNTFSKKGDCLGLNGNTLLIQPCKSDGSDTWQEFANGEFVHKKSGKCMTMTKAENGNQIELAECSGNPNQHWHEQTTMKGLTSKKGQFLIENNEVKGKCLDIYGKSADVGDKIILWTCWIDDNQLFVWL